MPESQVPLYPQLVPPSRDATIAQRLASIDRQLAGLNRNSGFISAGALGASYRDLILQTSSLISYWRLDETSGTTANDQRGTNPGTYAGGYTQGQQSALADANYCVLLDGATGRVTTTYNPFTVGAKRTFSGWALRSNSTANHTLLGSSGASPVILRAKSGGQDVEFVPNGTSQTWTAALPPPGWWFHWALTYDDFTRTATLFINGVSQGSKTYASGQGYSASAGNLILGQRGGGTTEPFNGYFDDVAVFSELLPSGSILAHYGGASRQSTPFSPESITTAELLAGTITASDIATGTLTANLMSVTSLSAINSDLGTILAGTITGATFQTSASDPRVIMDSTGIYSKDASGTVLFKADASTGKITTLAGIGGPNLANNTSFENATLPGLATFQATVASSSAQAKHGLLSVLVTSTTVGNAIVSDSATASRRISVIPGENVTVSAWVYAQDAARNATLECNFYDSGGSLLGVQTGTAQVTTLGSWKRIISTLTPPTSAVKMGWKIIFDSDVAGRRFYVDAVQVERGNIVTAYGPRPDEVLPGTITGSAGGGTGEILTGTVGGGASGTGNDIAAGAIAYDRISVTNLAAINANLGNIVSGTVTGATIQTSSSTSTQRLVLDTNELSVRDTSNNSQVRLTASTGLLLRAETATTGTREINWWRPSDGSYAATISGSDAGSTGNWKPNYNLRTSPTGGGPSSAAIMTEDDSFGGFGRYARISAVQSSGTYYYVYADANAGVATSTSRLIIDSAGNSNFLQLPSGQTSAWHVRVTNSATVSIPTGGFGTPITFDTERWDNPNNDQHSTASNTDRLTCAAPGLYDIGGGVGWTANATGRRSLWIAVTSGGVTTIIALDERPNLGVSFVVPQLVSTQYRLAVGDFVQLVAFQTSGGALTLTKQANYSPEFWMAWLAP